MLRKAILSQFTQANSADLDDGAEPDPELPSLANVDSDDNDDLSIDHDRDSSDDAEIQAIIDTVEEAREALTASEKQASVDAIIKVCIYYM